MNKLLLGVMLGGILGVFDGLTALASAPELSSQIIGIVIGSTVKGLMAGVLIGWFARRVDSLPLGILFGLTIGLILAWGVAYMQAQSGQEYYWEIMLPGGLLGVIVGYATQRWGSRTTPRPA